MDEDETREAASRLLALMEYERDRHRPDGVNAAFRALLPVLLTLGNDLWHNPHAWMWDTISEALKIRDREPRPAR